MATIAQLDRHSILDILNREAPELRRRFGVRSIGLFGSYATGANRARSDVDILVELEEYTYRAYIDLLFHLEKAFGRKVDLVIARSIKPVIRDVILAETIYAEGLDTLPAGHYRGN
jgi:predicted nucleotidyltransferase